MHGVLVWNNFSCAVKNNANKIINKRFIVILFITRLIPFECSLLDPSKSRRKFGLFFLSSHYTTRGFIMSKKLNRRDFIKSTTAATAGVLVFDDQ
jgi:hypothetical protein